MMSQEVLQVVHEKDPWIEESGDIPCHHDASWPNIEEEAVQMADKKGRRKSWHAIKFERKRRKGVVESGLPGEARQKRPSWWNIFAAANQWPRSRRASQDGGRVTKENFPWMRSKSRSVDHGISAPYDLEALRAKVDGQFDRSLEKDLDGSTNSLSERRKTGPPENTTVYTVADRDTLTSVAARFDTTPSELTKLNRLATPYIFPGQQLYVPNRESAENESEGSTPVEDSHDDLPPEEKELLENLRPVSPKPGHVERVRTPSCTQGSSTETDDQESAVFRERFLKINVRHITDGQGVVGGVLLVTPNAVMFDPNVSDPLVIEHGPEAYGVIAPMEFVVNAAIYNDIAHMRVGHVESSSGEKPEIYYPKADKEPDSLMVKDETFPELVTGDDAESVCSCTEREGDAFPKAFDRDLVTPTNLEDAEVQQRALEERRKSLLDHHWAIPSRDRQSIDTDEMPVLSAPPVAEEHIDEEENSLAKESCHDSGIDIRETSLPPVVPIPTKKQYSDADIVLSKEWVPPITIAPTNVSMGNESESPARKKTNSVSFSLDSSSDADMGVTPLSTSNLETKDDVEKADTRKNKMLKRLSYPLSWMETLGGEKDDDKPPSHPQSAADVHHSSVFSKVFSRRSSVGTFIRQPTDGSSKSKAPPPKLDYRSMVSVEDMPELFVSFDKLIPRPARSCEDPPLYLRLRMGKPLNKPIPKSTPLMSYGKKKMRPEYWFSVPKNRVDELYKFIQGWVPHLYGELDEEKVRERGFSLVEMDTELWSEEPTPSASRHGSQDGEISELTKESWEVLPMSEEFRRAFYSSSAAPSLDIELSPPDLVGTTEILTDYHRECLCRHLPARAEGYAWTLIFSTSQHGFSLNSMYRKMQKLESPILMVIEDTDNNVFGTLTSCALQVSDHFYGTGESSLFTFTPDFKVYNWTGENLYFIKGNNESISIGAGDGKFGLWLDGDLYLGRSESCKTYGNEPLTPKIDFVVKTLECWAFISN
ncbi:nuclear receptor coactivator 7 isoform X1 [Anoplophora glabripennis]|uniref:nuclear receptor coactivator 7 isoform X1 n=3 Tax=Anoplophora glabripennis TaxID=217634 RepID=UPI000C77F35D|nr:nuclear receptor coactivator 7 isoform X1 [Anoplophora glabripennis]